MISTQDLTGELSDLGQAIGLIKDGGLNGDWFGDPQGSLRTMLSDPGQRQALMNLVNALLPPATIPGIPDSETWHPLLGDEAVAGFARDVGPGQGFLRPINLVPNFYQTFSDDLASPNQFAYTAAAAPKVAKKPAPRTTTPASASTLIPMVTCISPAAGAPAGGTTVTITGQNFTGVTAVQFGSTAATSFTFVSDSEVTAVSPAGTGNVPISVTTPVGTSASKGTVTEGNNPVNHPYVNTSGVMMIPPNQDVPVTLLVEPHSLVHATTGITPRKEIGMRREWVAAALSKIAPTFRFGPVLVDPQRIRMPIPNEIHGTWSWDHRSSITDWGEDKVTNTTGDALIPPDPAKAQEGWLRMQPQASDGKTK